MKAWRNPKNQTAFREAAAATLVRAIKANGGRPIQAHHDQARWIASGRVGKALRDSGFKIVGTPSVLVQQLMLRAGIWGRPAEILSDLQPNGLPA